MGRITSLLPPPPPNPHRYTSSVEYKKLEDVEVDGKHIESGILIIKPKPRRTIIWHIVFIIYKLSCVFKARKERN